MEEDKEKGVEKNTEASGEPGQEGALRQMAEEDVGVAEEGTREEGAESLRIKCEELNDKYLRLYAELENYKKRAAREKQDLLKYGSESLVFELLTVLDTLELALKHADEDDSANGLRQGIEMTLKAFQRVLEKFGLKQLEAFMKPFDPVIHEAMSQVVRDDVEEGMVVDEFRKGYKYYDKLLRPALVSVSTKNKANSDGGEDSDAGNEMSDNKMIKEDDNG